MHRTLISPICIRLCYGI